MTLVRRLEKFATAICWKRLADHKDQFGPLVNDIVWRVIRQADSFKDEAKFSTWVYRIIVNECNRFLRREKELLEIGLEEDMPIYLKGIDARIDLIALLNRLDGPDHQLVRLMAEGHDFKTIAQLLGISLPNALVRWTRLKKRLRNAEQSV